MDEVYRLIGKLDALYRGEAAAASLVEFGPGAIGPLRKYLLEGKARKVFLPRLWAVEALAHLDARDVLVTFLFQEQEVADPEERFGEEAVASAAARCLAAWPDEDTRRLLLELSERRLLNGVIEALAEFQSLEAIPYFERALEDDFYRAAAERAFLKLGVRAGDALSRSAVTPSPSYSMETPGSLERRRSAVRLLNSIGISAAQWRILRPLVQEPDTVLAVEAVKLGIRVASTEDRALMAQRLIEALSSAPWHLRLDIEKSLLLLKSEAADEVDKEIAQRLDQPEDVRILDTRLKALLRVKQRWDQASVR